MFSFMRDRKKSSVGPSPEPSPGRPSLSSSKSDGPVTGGDEPDAAAATLMPPIPSLPPLRPIPVGQEFTRPSQAKGFDPPARRGKLVPPALKTASSAVSPKKAPASPEMAKSASVPPPAYSTTTPVAPPPEEGTFELKSFRHVRPVSPGPNAGVLPSGRGKLLSSPVTFFNTFIMLKYAHMFFSCYRSLSRSVSGSRPRFRSLQPSISITARQRRLRRLLQQQQDHRRRLPTSPTAAHQHGD